MALTAGTRLGPYEILLPIGKGGMGEVYKANDTRLDRTVAIKVLPEHLAESPERKARFEREAKAISQLNHPHICTLHDVGEQDGIDYLVMEYIEGETLADRIGRGPLHVDEAIPLFIQIAEGLETAHEKGIIHRDLKPANIMIGADGKPKIMDFGLAKSFASAVENPRETSESPTATKHTALGVIMGTPPYMSPEQVEGKTVDRRTDIWAFGCCLYETLSGRKAFDTGSVPSTVAAVIGSDPDWAALPAESSARVGALLRICLEKDRRRRVRDFGDVQLALDGRFHSGTGAAPRHSSAMTLRRILLVSVPAAIVGAVLTLVVFWVSVQPASVAVHRSFIDLAGIEPSSAVETNLEIAISPDGAHIAFVADVDGRPRLLLKSRDELEPQPVSGAQQYRKGVTLILTPIIANCVSARHCREP